MESIFLVSEAVASLGPVSLTAARIASFPVQAGRAAGYRSARNHLSSRGFRKTPSLKCWRLRTGLNFTAQQRADGGSVSDLSWGPETEGQTRIDSVQPIISTGDVGGHQRDPGGHSSHGQKPSKLFFPSIREGGRRYAGEFSEAASDNGKFTNTSKRQKRGRIPESLSSPFPEQENSL